jgi:general stress protein YciG
VIWTWPGSGEGSGFGGVGEGREKEQDEGEGGSSRGWTLHEEFSPDSLTMRRVNGDGRKGAKSSGILNCAKDLHWAARIGRKGGAKLALKCLSESAKG